MKITFKPLAKALLVISSLLLFNSCIKKVENTASAKTGTATVEGKVTANLDDTKDGDELVVKKPVYVFIDESSYASDPGSGVYPKRRFTGETGTDGKFKIVVDVPLKGTSIEISVPDFVEDVDQQSAPSVRTIFNVTPITVAGVKDGSVVIRDIVLK
jgi:hypothetical protein